MMKLSAYECRVILLMVSLCWGSALHPARDTEMTGHGWGLYVVGKQSCPTWCRETKHNGVTRCVCGARIENKLRCNDATQETMILAGYL